MRLFYASDLHGSEPCFRKFINAAQYYNVDALLLGGDLTGKAILPLIEQENGRFRVRFLGKDVLLEDPDSAAQLEKRARAMGLYPRRLSPEQARELLTDPRARDEA